MINKSCLQSKLISQFSLWLILMFLMVLSSCKKDVQVNEFEKYVGNWKPILFSDWNGMHNAPPLVETPGTKYTVFNNLLCRSVVTLYTDTNGLLDITSLKDTFDLVYTIKSYLVQEGSSKLHVSEFYQGYTKDKTLAVTLKYENETDLKNTSVNNPNNKFSVYGNEINVFYYTWGGCCATVYSRRLQKIE
jgi:hypothetical protein